MSKCELNTARKNFNGFVRFALILWAANSDNVFIIRPKVNLFDLWVNIEMYFVE